MSYYLAIDLGAESGRAIKGTIARDRLTIEEIHRFPNTPVPVQGTLYWDVLGMLREIRTGLRKCAAESADEPRGIGVDTWGVDFGLLDGYGTLLSNPVHYRDHRTDGMIELATSIVPREEIYRHTGIAFMPFNTLFQLLSLHRCDPPWLANARMLLFMPDLLHYFLCGRKAVEYTIATTSQLLDAKERDWSTELCEKLGLRRDLLPEIIPPGTVLDTLSAETQRECGVGPVPVITPAAHDTGCAFAAVPASDENYATISCGTWSILGRETDEPRTGPDALAFNFANEGAVGGKIRLLKNIMGLWVLQECRRSWARAGHDLDYATLTKEAAAAKPFPVIFDIDDTAFYAPDDMPTALAEQCKRTGQTMPENCGEIVRAIIEGLALRYRAVLGELEQLLGRKVAVVHLVGGGIQNKLLCQMAANAVGRPVIAGPVEATALGNIIMQAVGSGEIGSVSQARELVRRSVEIETYEPADTAAWDDAFDRYQNLRK